MQHQSAIARLRAAIAGYLGSVIALPLLLTEPQNFQTCSRVELCINCTLEKSNLGFTMPNFESDALAKMNPVNLSD
jgi:hypothetical protein